jgi:hypothetical protein
MKVRLFRARKRALAELEHIQAKPDTRRRPQIGWLAELPA